MKISREEKNEEIITIQFTPNEIRQLNEKYVKHHNGENDIVDFVFAALQSYAKVYETETE